MVSLRGYIIDNFIKSFLTVFIPFFVIISLIYLVRISALTSHISLSFSEIMLLYIYSLPDILFYTLPLSFVTALANTMIRLSIDNELIALYALGVTSKRIIRTLLPLTLLTSLLLLTLSFLAMPMSKQLYKAFKHQKRSEAKLSISPGKLGQKFGNFYIYVKDKDDQNTFDHLVIYNRSDIKDEQFFAAQHGYIKNEGSQTSLLLEDGYGYTYQKKGSLQQARYTQLEVFDTGTAKEFHLQNIKKYLLAGLDNKRTRHRFYFFIFISFIPLMALYPVAAFSMINPRYQANYALSIIFVTTFSLYMVAAALKNKGSFTVVFITISFILIVGYTLFQRRVARYF